LTVAGAVAAGSDQLEAFVVEVGTAGRSLQDQGAETGRRHAGAARAPFGPAFARDQGRHDVSHSWPKGGPIVETKLAQKRLDEGTGSGLRRRNWDYYPAAPAADEEDAMPRGRISIGVDDATGQPDNAPRGPYITDKDDGSVRPRRRPHDQGAGRQSAPTAKRASRGAKDLASRRKRPAQP